MAKEALIKVRCSQELKDRLEKLSAAKEQSLSDFVRTKLLDVLPSIEAQVEADFQAAYHAKKKKTLRIKRSEASDTPRADEAT